MLKRKKPLRWITVSGGGICVWWHENEILIDQEDFKFFHRYYHTVRITKFYKPDGTLVRERVPIMYIPRKSRSKEKFKFPTLARIVMNAGNWQKIIHLNGNQWDCRKQNLRIWTQNTKKNWTKELKNETKSSLSILQGTSHGLDERNVCGHKTTCRGRCTDNEHISQAISRQGAKSTWPAKIVAHQTTP